MIGGGRRLEKGKDRGYTLGIGFHWMINERYLHNLRAKRLLSRVTEPIDIKLYLPLKLVKEGRSIRDKIHSVSLLIVNVFL